MDRLREGVRFELSLQVRRPTVWVLGGLFLFPLVGVTLDRFQRADGEVLFAAPLSVAESGVLLGLVAMLIVAPVAGDAATRDVRTGLEPLMHAAPVSKATYLWSRFLGAFCIAAVLAAAGPLAHVLVPLSDPDLAREVVGPVRPAAYVGSYLLFLLPNAFVATALAFALASLVRHSLGAWAGILLIVVASQGSLSYLGDVLGHWDLAQALDPTGIATLDYLAQTWTPAESNVRPIAPGVVLPNRVIWVAAAAVLLLLAFRRFNFGAEAGAIHRWRRSRRGRKAPSPGFDDPPSLRRDRFEAATATVQTDRATSTSPSGHRIRQTISVTLDSLRELAPPWLWPVAPALVALQFFLSLAILDTMAAGTPVLPVTSVVVETLLPGGGDLPPPIALAVLLVPILMAGELVWRERDANLAGLADTAPVSAGVWFTGKVLGLWAVIATFFVLIAAGGTLAQLWLGGDLDPLLLGRVQGLRMVRPLLLALFAFAVHVVVNRKHLGHVIALLLVVPMIGELFGIEHPLLLLGWGPDWHYSPISGFQPFLASVLWFDLYWAGWALLAACVARLFWVRGWEPGLRERGRVALQRLGGAPLVLLGVSVVLVIASGSVLIYNLHFLNPFRTEADVASAGAEYERRYGHIRTSPQPQIVATDLEVEIYPTRGQARLAGVHLLENRTGGALDTLHVALSTLAETQRLALDRPARLELQDVHLGHRTYLLDEPLASGDALRLAWEVEYRPRGFSTTRMVRSAVIGNGSFLRMQDWMPLIGYQFGREVVDHRTRREMGLPPRPPLPPPDAEPGPIDRWGRERVDLSVTVGTSPDQIAVAPGELVRTWTENDRSYFRYRTGAPVGNGYAVFSARYAVTSGQWREVDIEVLHHPEHDANVRTMVRSMEASLEQLSERFGPYPYRTMRLVEYPSSGGSLHAASGTIWYQELFSHFDPERDRRQVDLPFAVVAHEVAHQFQPVPARLEGQVLLSESFAWYAALGVIEEEYGPAHLQRFLGFMRRAYLTPRSRADVPLLRANDSFLGYRKGPFAMHALREYVGQERVDRAWRTLREQHASEEPPFATSLDLYGELERVTPDSLRPLLGDLLERNTYWDLKATGARARQAAQGRWRVAIDIDAHKSVVDTAGAETAMSMNDLIEIGVYGDDPLADPLYLDTHRIRTGPQTITVTVREPPARAAIDPRHLLIDLDPGDNLADISEPDPEGS